MLDFCLFSFPWSVWLMSRDPRRSWRVSKATWNCCHLISKTPPSSAVKRKACTAGSLSTTWWETSWRQNTLTHLFRSKCCPTFFSNMYIRMFRRKTCGTLTHGLRGQRQSAPWTWEEPPHRSPLQSRMTRAVLTTCILNCTATPTTFTHTATCATAKTRLRRWSWTWSCRYAASRSSSCTLPVALCTFLHAQVKHPLTLS